MGRRAISITLAVVCLAVLLGATGLFAISRETSYMQKCASEGFAIDGYYRDDKTSLETLAFLEEDNHRWQLVDKDGSCVDGQFKRTDDPNILILKKENGEEFGTVHVAYMSRRREQGQLYLFRDSKVPRFYLVSTKPAFTVESGDVDLDS
ncbi:hypothetical protein AAAX77_06820 [Collinsella sp. CLA-ER-H6]